MTLKEKIIQAISEATGLPKEEISLTTPEHAEFGHYSTNVAFRIAKKEGVSHEEVARRLSRALADAGSLFLVGGITNVSGYLNFLLKPAVIQEEFARVYKNRKTFGCSKIGKGKKVIVEYSQPNIAKQMHVGHLRTTIIGDALAQVHKAGGYKIVRWNYLGDWGTQFGNLIAAYKKWGKEKELEKNPLQALEALYVRFTSEAKTNEELKKKGQEEFKKLEEGDAENKKLWKWFRDISIQEIKKVYAALGVEFDEYKGEAFFEPYLEDLLKKLKKKGLLEESEGALIIPLDHKNLPPALMQKSDGASLYLTRDVAALEYRAKKYKPEKLLYVVGNEQTLHFSQLFELAKLLESAPRTELAHVKYGLMLGEDGKKMSTREGTSIPLQELLGKIVSLAKEEVSKKNPNLTEAQKKEVARMVGIGAIKYNDLKENRLSDIRFDWKKMLDFRGDSAPYLQYTHARLKSIMRRSEEKVARRKEPKIFSPQLASRFSLLSSEAELALMRHLFEFPDEIKKSADTLYTNNIAKYLYDLATLANRLYESTPILKDENERRRHERLLLIETVAIVLQRGLGLLGIEAPEEI